MFQREFLRVEELTAHLAAQERFVAAELDR